MPVIPSDIEIAQAAKLVHVNKIAEQLGLDPDTDLEHYGKYMAKINLEVLERLKDRPTARYIDVTAITPTPLGEGKSNNFGGIRAGAQSHRQAGYYNNTATIARSDIWNKGRCGWRRI